VPDPKKPYSIHAEATLDLRLAARWYDERQRGLGVELVLAVDGAIAKIVESPQRWPAFSGARRYILRRFPFSVIYRVVDGRVQVVAVAHHSRRPSYWGQRL